MAPNGNAPRSTTAQGSWYKQLWSPKAQTAEWRPWSKPTTHRNNYISHICSGWNSSRKKLEVCLHISAPPVASATMDIAVLKLFLFFILGSTKKKTQSDERMRMNKISFTSLGNQLHLSLLRKRAPHMFDKLIWDVHFFGSMINKLELLSWRC